MFSCIYRKENRLLWLFNVEADTREQALARGRSLFRAYPADSVIAKMYSIRETDVRPLSQWESELIGYGQKVRQ